MTFMLRNIAGLGAGLICCLLPQIALTAPLVTRNLNPLLTVFELPPSLPADLRLPTQFDTELALSNTSQNQRAQNEHAQVDAEVRRWQLTYARTVESGLRLQIELPYQQVSGGSLDSFIENFHDVFSLPNGNRAIWPRNRLLLTYTDGTHPSYYFANDRGGLADITLRAGWQLKNSGTHLAALWMSLKLPTGDADKFTGSGAMDVSMALATQQQCTGNLRCYQQVSLSRLGTADHLGFMQKHWVWAGLLGVDWRLTPAWTVLAELHGRSAAYDSNIRLLGKNAQLSFGPRYESGAWQTTFSLTEDIAVDTAPDIHFQLNITRSF